jgi:DNA-directed RNA polymerase III subunit RPC8
VISKCGVCIGIFDILTADDPVIYPSEGSCHQQVQFRLIVFRPIIGEVITGKLSECSEDGIHVSLDFFDDIFVPSSLLPTPSEWRSNGRDRPVWIWRVGEGDNEGDINGFAMEIGDMVKKI